jgi:hypothetical protein
MFAERVEFINHGPSPFNIRVTIPSGSTDAMPSTYQFPGTLIGTIGRPLVLMNQYHPDQMWLSFVVAVCAHAPPSADDDRFSPTAREWQRRQAYDHDLQLVRRRAAEPIYVTDEMKQMYHWPRSPVRHDPSFEQYLLPFHEYRRCPSIWQFRFASHLWDKLEDEGKYESLILEAPKGLAQRLKAWCDEHCVGQYFIGNGGEVTFARHAEWMHAKLLFHGAEADDL